MHPILLVAAGGVVGALARAAVDAAVCSEPGTWSWSTLTVNALGAAALVLLVARQPSRQVRLLLGTGLLGSFTTFSAFAVDAVLLVEGGAPGTAAAYVAAGVLTLLAGAAAGVGLGRGVRR